MPTLSTMARNAWTSLKNEGSQFKQDMGNNYRDAKTTYRKVKMSASLKVHGVNSDGLGKKIKLSEDRLVEACCLPGTADICIDLSRTRYSHENPGFITALNLLECSLCASARLFGNDLCESQFIQEELPSHVQVPFMGSPEPAALLSWIRNTFISGSGDLSINVASQTRTKALAASSMKDVIIQYRKCRDEVSKMWVLDMASSFQTQEAYLQNIWTFDTKFQKSHHSDIRQRIESAVNKKFSL